jgi:putative ABC transport system ATP-binding protein
MALIELTDVSKTYGPATAQPALDNLSFHVATGEFVAVMGPSGSGKSTLLNLIAGLDRPSRGAIRVAEIDLQRLSEAALARFRRTHFGIIFQLFHLLPNLSVRENVLLPARLAGVPLTLARRRADELLEQFRVAAKADAYAATLSGGECQRVAIARALINRPPVLLADEPTGALDSRAGREVMEVLERANQQGQTIVLATHDARLASTYARRIVHLRDGRVVDDASLEPVRAADVGALIRITMEERRR